VNAVQPKPEAMRFGLPVDGATTTPTRGRFSGVNDFLSTREMGWLLNRSPGSIREMIREGAIDGVRLPVGFKVRKEEALRLARERIEAEAGRKLSDRELERLIDEVVSTNEQRT
jgi:hypothetical protein